MQHATVIFNRQVLRLCKGILKAWEQWMDEVDREVLNKVVESHPHVSEEKTNSDGNKNDRLMMR